MVDPKEVIMGDMERFQMWLRNTGPWTVKAAYTGSELEVFDRFGSQVNTDRAEPLLQAALNLMHATADAGHLVESTPLTPPPPKKIKWWGGK